MQLSQKIQATEQQGKASGEVKEGQTLILRQLNRRVRNLSIDLESQFKTLPLTQLEELGEALLDFSQIDDLVV
jgi:ribosomal 50S subunit-recycling heat shock protein